MYILENLNKQQNFDKNELTKIECIYFEIEIICYTYIMHDVHTRISEITCKESKLT